MLRQFRNTSKPHRSSNCLEVVCCRGSDYVLLLPPCKHSHCDQDDGHNHTQQNASHGQLKRTLGESRKN